MTTLTLPPRLKIPDNMEVPKRIEFMPEFISILVRQRMQAIAEEERKKINLGEGRRRTLSEIAYEIENTIIRPYAMTFGNPHLMRRMGILREINKLGEMSESSREFKYLDSRVKTSLIKINSSLSESYSELYHGCCDLNFNRFFDRSNGLLDYTPVSEKIRPGTGFRRDNSYWIKKRRFEKDFEDD